MCFGREPLRLTEEEVICIGTPAPNLENLDQVIELAVYVADDGYRGAHVHDVALAHKQLFGLCAYCLDHRLGEELLFI